MERCHFAKLLGFTSLLGWARPSQGQPPPANADRAYWLQVLALLARPILAHLAANELRAKMPVEAHQPDERRKFCHLEAFGRLLTGIAPWLNLASPADPAEAKLHQELFRLASTGLANGVNPQAKDYFNFAEGAQPLVDAAFLAHALLRCPRLWEAASPTTQAQTVEAFRQTRKIRPYPNNWLLFSGMIEAFFFKYGYEADLMRVDYALKQHEQWYKGDATYGDGQDFHWDYYNSFVIQPFMVDIMSILKEKDPTQQAYFDKVLARAMRYAQVQERMIAPDGTFPIVGRSMAYRAGAFHHLAAMALREQLPAALAPAQVRGALTAVLRKTTGPANFDAQGWLRLGLNGHQPKIAETYICTGSLYLCAAALLPLGLPASAPFWAGEAQPWTSARVWAGGDIEADRAYY
jgi:hypothetical protein